MLNNPLNIDTAGLSEETADAVTSIIAKLAEATDVSRASAPALTLSEVVEALRTLRA